jgi:hypothetical protein
MQQFSWPMRLLQGLVALAVGTGAAVVVRRSPQKLWLLLAAIVVARLVFDPVMHPYYWLELQALFLVGMITVDKRPVPISILDLFWQKVSLIASGIGCAVLLGLPRRPRPYAVRESRPLWLRAWGGPHANAGDASL